MVKLRLKRMGAINKPFYRIVAVDSRKKRDGKYLEALGYYDPKTDPFTLKVDVDKSIKWLKLGAQPSDTVRSLFKRTGIMEKFHNEKVEVIKEKKEAAAPAKEAKKPAKKKAEDKPEVTANPEEKKEAKKPATKKPVAKKAAPKKAEIKTEETDSKE